MKIFHPDTANWNGVLSTVSKAREPDFLNQLKMFHIFGSEFENVRSKQSKTAQVQISCLKCFARIAISAVEIIYFCYIDF
jgi:hypothetical protein